MILPNINNTFLVVYQFRANHTNVGVIKIEAQTVVIINTIFNN